MNLEIGNHFKAARRARNLTQQQICKEIKISRSYYSEIENNVKIPTIELFLQISNFLHIKPDLFSNTDFSQFELQNSFLDYELKKLSKQEYDIIYETIIAMIDIFNRKRNL